MLAPLVLKEHNLPPDCFQAGVDRTANPEIQSLIGYNERKKKYVTFPPVLYKDLKEDPVAIFLNTSLPMVLYAVFCCYRYLFGGLAL
jgi:hypothetical protein